MRITLEVNNSNPMEAYVATPQGEGQFPAIIVFQEAYGVNAPIRDVADKLAQEGFLAVAPELFHRTAPAGYEAGYGDFSVVMPHFQAITPEGLTDDINAVYNWLQAQPNVKGDKIGTIGFCLGGRVSYFANSVVKLAAAVSFYGGSTHTIADRAKEFQAPMLMFWGGKDTHILPEHVQTVTDALKEAGKDYVNVVVSYAEHAFFNHERPSYHARAAKESWALTLAFLDDLKA
jgi:carboxymethylenebutenolidase